MKLRLNIFENILAFMLETNELLPKHTLAMQNMHSTFNLRSLELHCLKSCLTFFYSHAKRIHSSHSGAYSRVGDVLAGSG